MRRHLTWTLFAALGSGLAAQAPPPAAAPAGQAANRWRFQPTPDAPLPADPQERATLIARGQYWDFLFGNDEPLDGPRTHGSGVSFSGGPAEEVPVYANETVITGTFVSERALLSATRRSIYTDVRVLADGIVYSDLNPPPAGIGSEIDVLLPFGAVQLTDDRVIQIGLSPTTPYIQPGRRYLFFLFYRVSGNFFELVKTWELVNGIAVPSEAIDVARQQAGHSLIAGLSEPTLIATVIRQIGTRKGPN